MKNTKPLILVDGSSYLYRAFHALPALANSKGQPTGAVYGIINMLKRLIADYSPTHMAVIFDAKGKTFRDDIFEAYKATRVEMPRELVQQIEPIHQIIKALGLPLIMIDGVEADDVIGTLAKAATEQKIDVLISTGDKDLAQLVNEHVKLINTMTNTLLDRTGVIEKFGVPPEGIIDYLTLVGDTSDNIPGVPLVGPKTAAKWLQEYKTLKHLIEHAQKITGKAGENLRESISQFDLVRSLVSIKLDVHLPIGLSDLAVQSADKIALIQLYQAMEFRTWLSELLTETKESNQTKYVNYRTITTEESFNEWLLELNQVDRFAFDTITSQFDYMNAQLIGLALMTKPGFGVYIPFGHDNLLTSQQLPKNKVIAALKSIFENPRIKKIGQNIKYNIEILANENIHLQGDIYDTMMESYILDSGSNAHDIDSLALKFLGWRTITLEDVAGKGAKQLPLNQIDVEQIALYAAENTDVAFRVHEKLWERIESDAELKRVYEEIEMPLIPVLAEIERCGVLIDPQKLIEQGKALQKRLLELEKEAYAMAGQTFNMNSPKQLQEVLFQKLHLPVLQKTPTGQASTADSVLQELALEFALPKIIIEYRSLSKLISTYTTKLVAQMDAKTCRIHTYYNQAATATGRLSSSEPNLQNIPIRTSEGRRIRQAFVAPKGYKIISADYSQIELRLMAHISEDPNLLHAFASNLDIHRATAAEVWEIPIEKVTNEMRRNAKAINFGLIYGMSAFGLTRQLGIERKAAEEYINRYFTRYPHVKAYMDNTRKHAKEKGYVETLWGRRLYLPDINASQIPRQKAAERAAINGPLQGSAADIIKLAMVSIQHWLQAEKIPARMIMQVHDELVFEAKEDELEAIMQSIVQHMTSVVALQVPLVVSIGAGDDWDKASTH